RRRIAVDLNRDDTAVAAIQPNSNVAHRLAPHIPSVEKAGEIESESPHELVAIAGGGFPIELEIHWRFVERHDALILLLVGVANHPVSRMHPTWNLFDALDELVLERIREDHGVTDSPALRPTRQDRSPIPSGRTSSDGPRCPPRNIAARRMDTS